MGGLTSNNSKLLLALPLASQPVKSDAVRPSSQCICCLCCFSLGASIFAFAADEEEEKEEELPTTKKEMVKQQNWEQLNTQNAIWLRSPSEVSSEEYENFYQAISKVKRTQRPSLN